MFRCLVLVFTLFSIAVPVSFGQVPTHALALAAASLTVTLTGVHNDKGQVFIQLWRSPDGFPLQSQKVYKLVAIPADKARNGVITTTFLDLAPGTYAVSSLHDENLNGKMDSNAFGIPKEGWAVSNNVVTRLHAPSFEQASFSMASTTKTICIALHY